MAEQPILEGPIRERIVDAAVQAIKTRGSKGASARAIAEIGGFNQALIYYYFANLKGLLIEALRATSAARLDRYRRDVGETRELTELIAIGRTLYAEDQAEGYLKVLSELVSACVTHPDLRGEVLASLQPWIGFAQELMEGMIAGSTLEGLLPTRDLAQALVAAYMGLEMLHHLDGDAGRADRLFSMLESFALIAPMFGTPGTASS